ncbi:unnamed protein product [Amoebophrya sp. A120]|nr:unnamed protein product [Amoebophrya sp. A120]|eukprot:GSA120T00010777001.1
MAQHSLYSPCRDYWDLEELISEEELIPCETNHPLYHAAHLLEGVGMAQRTTGSAEELTLPAGTKLKLPFWLAQALIGLTQTDAATGQIKGTVQFEAPNQYCDSLVYSLASDPSKVHLRNFSPFYFEIGSRMAFVFHRYNVQLPLDVERMAWPRLRNQLFSAAKARWNATITMLGRKGVAEHVDPLYVQMLTYVEENLFFGIREAELAITEIFNVMKSDEDSKSKKIRRIE